MEAHQLLKAGQLTAAIAAVRAHLSRVPHDGQAQTFLYELICFTGDFDQAAQQLEILVRSGSPESEAAIARYRSVLEAERQRQVTFLHRSHPRRLVNGGQCAFAGTLNGKPFLTFSDADPRIGDQLELLIAGEYFWLALCDVRRLQLPAPRRLRDLLWLPAELEVAPTIESGSLRDVWLPMMTPLTWQHPDEEVRLGRVSEWRENQFGDFAPFGIKTYLVDGAELPLAEIRELLIQPTGHHA